MSAKPPEKPGKPPGKTANPETPLRDAGQVAVTYSDVPPKGPPGKQIHPRRKLPEIPSKPPRKPEDD